MITHDKKLVAQGLAEGLELPSLTPIQVFRYLGIRIIVIVRVKRSVVRVTLLTTPVS